METGKGMERGRTLRIEKGRDGGKGGELSKNHIHYTYRLNALVCATFSILLFVSQLQSLFVSQLKSPYDGSTRQRG